MSMRSWIRSLFTRPATRRAPVVPRKAPRRARLSLEALEARWVPSTFTVVNGNDDGDGSLRAAIAAANDETNNQGPDIINFDPSVTTVTLNSGQLNITSDITITAPDAGVTITRDATAAQFGILAIDTGASAELTGLTISGGDAGATGKGGGIYSSGTATLTNCTLSGNTAGVLGGTLGGYGGGMYADAGSTTTLTDCTVSGNTAIYAGGVNSYGALTMDHCTLSNNIADHGGALENDHGTTTMTYCTVSDNRTTVGGGGAIFWEGQATLTNCTFSDNSGSRGGGLWINNATVQLVNTTVSGNTARTTNGGGLYNFHGNVTLTNCTVSGNSAPGTSTTAGAGGGLGSYCGQTTLNHCTVSGNSATATTGNTGAGGGLFLNGAGQTTLNDCTVSDNSSYRGGGLYAYRTTVQLINTTVSGNTATVFYGGGVYSRASATTLTNCTVSCNSASSQPNSFSCGGGLYLFDGGQTTLTNCTVLNNSAYRGAGLFARSTTAQLVNTTVSGNTATSGSGAGVYNRASNVTLTNCTVSGNSAPRSCGGGAYGSAGSTTTLTNCTVSGNSAGAGGGGIFNLGALTVTGGTLSGNSANDGGGINNNGSAATATVTNSTLSGNSAGAGGGGISNAGGTLTLTGSTLSGNTASAGGGLNTFGNATVTNSTLAGNSACVGGGIINGGTLRVVNCTVSGNSATSGNGGGIDRSSNGSTTLGNTIVAGNTASGSGPDVYGTMVSLGHNLIGKTNGSSGWVTSDLQGTSNSPINPLLAPLGYYGAPTQTMPLLPGSRAIDAGSNGLIPAGITTDQRGLPRIVNTTVDIGAFESSGFTIAVVSGNGQSANGNTNFQNALVVTVTAINPLEPVAGGLVTFTAPTTGASASFNGAAAIISNTGTVSVTATANGSGGSYTVTATAQGVTNSVIFTLTNVIPPPTNNKKGR
jgi:hypothetical protein